MARYPAVATDEADNNTEHLSEMLHAFPAGKVSKEKVMQDVQYEMFRICMSISKDGIGHRPKKWGATDLNTQILSVCHPSKHAIRLVIAQHRNC